MRKRSHGYLLTFRSFNLVPKSHFSAKSDITPAWANPRHAPATKHGRIFAIVYAMVTLPVFAHALSLLQSYVARALSPEGANRFKTLALTGTMVK